MANINSLEQLSKWGLYLEQHNDNVNQESLNGTSERYSMISMNLIFQLNKCQIMPVKKL